jgi:hypothetical protein
MSLKDILNEVTTSSDIATHDKKIGEEKTIKEKFNTKNDISDFIKKFKKGFDISITYNPVTKEGIVNGVVSNVETFINRIKGM